MVATQCIPFEPPGDVEVIELTRDEYDRAVKAELDGLGLSYRQLRAQARNGRFGSLRARKLWLAVGERDSGC